MIANRSNLIKLLLLCFLFISMGCRFISPLQNIINPEDNSSQVTDEIISDQKSDQSDPASAQNNNSDTPVASDTQPGEEQFFIETAGREYQDSYRLSFYATVNGVDEYSNPAYHMLDLKHEVNNVQNDIHYFMNTEGVDLEGVIWPVDLFMEDQQAYIYQTSNPSVPCLIIDRGEVTSELLALIQPDEMFDAIEVRGPVEKNLEINGVITDRYETTQIQLSIGQTSNANGEVWLAQKDRSVIRFTGAADGDFELNEGEITHGTVQWEYDLFDINQEININIPEACSDRESSKKNELIPPNATDVNILGPVITYNSPDSPQAVVDWYHTTLGTQGWRIEQTIDSPFLKLLSVYKDGESKKIAVNLADNGGSMIIISEE